MGQETERRNEAPCSDISAPCYRYICLRGRAPDAVMRQFYAAAHDTFVVNVPLCFLR